MVDGGGRRLTALIVEDDPGQSQLGAALLEEFDLEVGQVTSGEAALDHLLRCSGAISVLLADVNLAGAVSGLELARRVSVLWPTVSVIVTSGDPAHGATADLPPRATFIPKPWRPLDIVAAAERAARQDHSVRAVAL